MSDYFSFFIILVRTGYGSDNLVIVVRGVFGLLRLFISHDPQNSLGWVLGVPDTSCLYSIPT